MRRFFHLFFAASITCMMLVSVVPARGETIPGQVQNGTAAGEVNVAPELIDLHPGWWRYFDISGIEELNKRIALFDKRLKKLTVTLSPNKRKALSPFAVRIRANLNALRDIRTRKPVEPAPPGVLAEKYSINDLIKLLGKLREKTTEIKEDTIDKERLSSAVNDAVQHLNDLLASYMSMPERSPERLEKGFEIVAKRLDVMTVQENLKIRREKLQALSAEVQFLEKELDHARRHLFSEGKDLEMLKQQIGEFEKNVAVKKRALVSAEIGSIGVPADTMEGKSRAKLSTQKAVFAAVDEARARLNLETARTELVLASLLARHGSKRINEIKEEIKAWKGLTGDLKSKADSWDGASKREYAGAVEDLSVLGEGALAKTRVLRGIHKERLKTAQNTLLAVKDLRLALTTEDFLLTTIQNIIAEKEGNAAKWYGYMRDRVAGSWAVFMKRMHRSLFTISETPVTLLGLLWLVLIIAFAFFFSKIVRLVLERLVRKSGAINESAFYTLARLIHYAILIIAVIAGLSYIGINFSSLLVVAGALSLGIGFGLQSIFNNFISGLILLFERPLKIGDVVELESGVKGTVRAINVRSTRITTFDNIDILVPNAEFISGRVTNYTLKDDFLRIHIPVGVAYGTDTELVTTALLEAANSLSYTVRQPEKYRPQVWLVKFGDSSLDFELLVWLNIRSALRPDRYRSEYMKAIADALHKYKITIPFPQRDVHIRSTPERGRHTAAPDGTEPGAKDAAP